MANELATLDDLFLSKKSSKPSQSLDDLFLTKKTPSKMSIGKALFTPAIASKVLGVPKGMTPGEQFREMYAQPDVPMPYPARFGTALAANLGGEAVDIATNPASYLIGPALKVAAPLVKTGVKAAQSGAGKSAIRIAQGILKPTGKYAPRSEKIAESSLKEGVLRSSAERTRSAAQSSIDDLMNQVDEIASTSTAQADLNPAFRRASATAKYWIGQGKPERARKIIEEVQNIASAKRLTPNEPMSVKSLLNLRRSQDEALKRLKPGGGFFSETLPADIEARQEFVGGMRKALGAAEPRIGEANKRISGLIDVANVAKKRTGVSSRNNLFDIMDYGIGTTAVASHNPAVAALLIGKKAWQGGKALAARGMYKFSKFGEVSPKVKPGVSGNVFDATAEEVIEPMAVGATSRKLLPAPRESITTSILQPEFAGPKSLRAPYYLEQSPIKFGEVLQGGKKSILKKMGIDPFTGKMKYGKPKTALQAALERIKSRSE